MCKWNGLVASVTFTPIERFKLRMIPVYALTSSYYDVDTNRFYEDAKFNMNRRFAYDNVITSISIAKLWIKVAGELGAGISWRNKRGQTL